MIILHALTKSLWNTYQDKDFYGELSLEKFGFIHCSDIDTYHLVAPNFKNEPDEMVLLVIDTSKVIPKIIWEDLRNSGVAFPHIYGLLNKNAVVTVLPHLWSDNKEWVANDELKFMVHKIFGTKEDASYLNREGAYIIPIKNNKVGVIKTPKGYFLLGGGIDKDESHEEAIKRECLEEAGYSVNIKQKLCSAEAYTKHPKIGNFHPIQTYYIGELLEKVQESIESDHEFLWIEYEHLKGKMFTEMQNWAIEHAKNFLK